jgi:hypothetical protein
LPIVSAEQADIFPLSVTDSVSSPDSDPFSFADRLPVVNNEPIARVQLKK